jgi:hypothetical protein
MTPPPIIQSTEEKCNDGKHFFINSEFCDRCNTDFDTWYTEIIKETKKDACVFILVVLQSIINEQIMAKQLKRDVGSYVYQSVKEQFIRKGWIE